MRLLLTLILIAFVNVAATCTHMSDGDNHHMSGDHMSGDQHDNMDKDGD